VLFYIIMPRPQQGDGPSSDPSVRPSVRLSVCSIHLSQQQCIFRAITAIETNRKPTLKVVHPPVSVAVCYLLEMAEKATKLSPAALQIHSLDGCTIDKPLSKCHRQGAYRFAARYPVQTCCMLLTPTLHLSQTRQYSSKRTITCVFRPR